MELRILKDLAESTVDSSQSTVPEECENPRTRLHRMRGTKVENPRLSWGQGFHEVFFVRNHADLRFAVEARIVVHQVPHWPKPTKCPNGQYPYTIECYVGLVVNKSFRCKRMRRGPSARL